MKRKPIQIILLTLLIVSLLAASLVLGLNAMVLHRGGQRIVEPSDAPEADCILVLGCLVYDSGDPSPMLADRLDQSIALYEAGAAPKLLMSGDHGHPDYSEPGNMQAYAVRSGVPAEDIFLDHAGFSTYESLYRAKEVFGAKRVLIVTQKYHLYRALYIAEALGLEAWGVPADARPYFGQTFRELREILARNKDVLTTLTWPAPTRLDPPISLTGDGTTTLEP